MWLVMKDAVQAFCHTPIERITHSKPSGLREKDHITVSGKLRTLKNTLVLELGGH